MALDRGTTMVEIRKEGRELLRTLAYKRRKPMYAVLEEALRETLQHDEKNQTALAESQEGESYASVDHS